VRRGGEPFAAHLIDGVTHPDQIVAPLVHEFKNGARTADSMGGLVRQLVLLRLSEENDRDRHEDELREEERKANASHR
jgi:hypothetical protein